MLEPSEGEYAGKFFYANANGLQRIMLPGARVYDYSVAPVSYTHLLAEELPGIMFRKAGMTE